MSRTARRAGGRADVVAGLALLGVLGLFAALLAGAFHTDRTTETRTISVAPGETKTTISHLYVGPTLDTVRPIPAVALIPLALLIYGFGVRMEVLVITYATVWPVLIVTISVARAYPSANELLGQMPSSHGEFTLQLETRTLRQQSMSSPSRSVSIFRLSMVRLSTPVAKRPKWPAFKIEKSRRITLRQFLRAMALFPLPGVSARGSSLRPELNPFPQIRPGPRMATSCRPSPQSKLLCQ